MIKEAKFSKQGINTKVYVAKARQIILFIFLRAIRSPFYP